MKNLSQESGENSAKQTSPRTAENHEHRFKMKTQHVGQQEVSPPTPELLMLPIYYEQAAAQVVTYKECLKNHAASIGGNSLDGCGEFMPSGEEGTLESFKCSACGCHRNFHRKVHSDHHQTECFRYHCSKCNYHHSPRACLFGTQHAAAAAGHEDGTLVPLASEPDHQIPGPAGRNIVVGIPVPSEPEDRRRETAAVMGRPQAAAKKRFRTKFTQEQKEKMKGFAERAGWKIHKLEESVVRQFCQDIGIRRRVLKVWMHNNKHHFTAKEPLSTS